MKLYPASAFDAFHGVGTRFPAHVDEVVKQIHAACKGMGTDEKALIALLGPQSPETRSLVALRYKELYGKPLRELVKSETSGDFGRLLAMISTPLPQTEAQLLRDATKGIGTTESLIVQILSGRTNEEIALLKRTYYDLVGRDLAVTMNAELSGDFRKVVMALLQAQEMDYTPQVHNAAKAEVEAETLYKAGQGRLGTNEEVFIATIVKCPPEFLKMVDAVYVAKYSNNIAKAVEKEFSGDAKRSLLFYVRLRLDPYPAIAELFERTMKGIGTDETGLSTALVRYQSLLPEVKAAYKRIYREELRDRIIGETSGDYKKLLLEVFDAPRDPPQRPASSAAGGAAVSASAGQSPAQHGYASGPTVPGQQPSPYTQVSQQQNFSLPGQVFPSDSAYAPPRQQSVPPTVATAAVPTSAAPGTAPVGYNQHQQGGVPIPAPGYPAPAQQQPQQPGYLPQQQSQPGYPPQQQQPGYPPQQQQPGYPPQQPGYPPQQPQPGYPPQQVPYGAPSTPSGYPPQQQPPAGYAAPNQYQYPPQQPPAGYPPAQAPGYPPPQGFAPPPQQPAGYPPAYQQPYAPPQQPYYPPAGQYPPPQQQAYGYAPPPGQYPPPQQNPYPPPHNGGYPPYGY